MTVLECYYTEPPHEHSYPDDWIFGGANGLDPRADPRYKSTIYFYYGADTQEIYRTVQFLCDDEALDMFTWVASTWRNSHPTWLAAQRPDSKAEMLPWVYDDSTDLLTPMERK